jgi:hypothetical protein
MTIRFEVVPHDSKVWIEGSSSLHPIHGEASGLTGYIEAQVKDGGLDLSAPARGRFELAVEELKSGNTLQDREMYRRIDARRYPTIVGEIDEVTPLNGTRYRVKGRLRFHGVEQAVDAEAKIEVGSDGSISAEGEHAFDIRSFGVEPPKILMLRVHPEVKVKVKVVARAEGGA